MRKKRVKWVHPLEDRTILETIAEVFDVWGKDVWRNQGSYAGGAGWGVFNSTLAKWLPVGRYQDLHSFSTMKECLKYGFHIYPDGEICANEHPYICDKCGKEQPLAHMHSEKICLECAEKEK